MFSSRLQSEKNTARELEMDIAQSRLCSEMTAAYKVLSDTAINVTVK